MKLANKIKSLREGVPHKLSIRPVPFRLFLHTSAWFTECTSCDIITIFEPTHDIFCHQNRFPAFSAFCPHGNIADSIDFRFSGPEPPSKSQKPKICFRFRKTKGTLSPPKRNREALFFDFRGVVDFIPEGGNGNKGKSVSNGVDCGQMRCSFLVRIAESKRGMQLLKGDLDAFSQFERKYFPELAERPSRCGK